MPRKLQIVQVGDPVLHKISRRLSAEEIGAPGIQSLIGDIRFTNEDASYGVGLAAPQVGESVALSVIGIKPTPNRPNLELFDQVIINPTYKGVGKPVGMWEGCQSCGEAKLFAQAVRYAEIEAEWLDETGMEHARALGGFVAHVFQHETDHLNGILFFERVIDPKTYMSAEEYRKRIIDAKG